MRLGHVYYSEGSSLPGSSSSSSSATRARIAARRSSPNVRASARACAKFADAARCRASGIACNDSSAGTKPTTRAYKRVCIRGPHKIKRGRQRTHSEPKDDDHLVLPRLISFAHTRRLRKVPPPPAGDRPAAVVSAARARRHRRHLQSRSVVCRGGCRMLS
jgi:hypothetical protein